MRLLIQFILLLFYINLVVGRSVRSITDKPRTHGNFVPKIPNVVEDNPDFKPSPAVTDPVAIAKQYIEKHSGQFPVTARVSSSHKSQHNGITHVYLEQIINGLVVSNGVANVNIDDKGKIISSGNSFYRHGAPPAIDVTSTASVISAPEAVLAFAKFLKLDIPSPSSLRVETRDGTLSVIGAPFALSPIPAEHQYVQVDGGSKLAHSWDLRVEMENNYYHTHVDSSTGNVIALVDWVSDATYTVYPLGINDPQSGSRATLKNPSRLLGSPLGWHDLGHGQYTTVTISNNVYAQNNPSGGNAYKNNYRPSGGTGLNFNFPLDLTKAPSQYQDASITNLFYWNNIIHDLYYAFGFNEPAGNFQQKLFIEQGAGNDAVIAFAQDGSGINNANFLTPPDGQHGVMRMYRFTTTTPNRDGDLDNGVVVHEYTHGLSNRLTGGRKNVNCLPDGEAGGMGEGWGDFIATILRMNSGTTRNTDFPIGVYVFGNSRGIRHFPYSTSLKTNPLTYGYLNQPEFRDEVHNAGEIWVELLFEVYWNLVDHHRFTSDWFDTRAKRGNIIMLQLVIDGMQIQPCRPTFIDARNAILTADWYNNGGDNFCRIYRGFAKRGLGVAAKNKPEGGVIESYDVPSRCRRDV